MPDATNGPTEVTLVKASRQAGEVM